MRLNFDKKSIQEWADFSGDFNPIHFDELKARQIGLDNLAVHGMLAMLPLKQYTADSFLKEQLGGYAWRSSLRYPLDIDKEYQLSLRNSDSKVSFTLHDQDQSKKYFIGSIQKNSFDEEMRRFNFSDTEKFHISSQFIKQKYQEFKATFPHISLLWIYIDALIFSIFISKHATELCVRKFKNFMGDQEQFIGDNVLFLHTNHQVYVSSHMSQLNIEKVPETINYSVMINDTTYHEDSLLISVVMPVWITGEISIIITMSIMGIKTYS